LGRRGLKRLKVGPWARAVREVATAFLDAFVADYVVIGGGNAKKIKNPPGGARLSNNLTAFRGGFRLWHVEDVHTLSGKVVPPTPPDPGEWRLI
jgi:hypothetical protein